MACTVEGSTTRSNSTASAHRSPTWTSVPTLAQVQSSSSMNRGVPSDRSTIAATGASGSDVPSSASTRAPASAAGSGGRSRWSVSHQAGSASSRLGRVVATTSRPCRVGARPAWSRKASRSAPAQWTSSTSHVSASGAQGIDGCQPGVEAGVPLGGEIPGRDRARGDVRAKQPADFLNDHLGARRRLPQRPAPQPGPVRHRADQLGHGLEGCGRLRPRSGCLMPSVTVASSVSRPSPDPRAAPR